jgi:8-oxo-dGTP pyrophosphatase MutT (NUDIX family)
MTIDYVGLRARLAAWPRASYDVPGHRRAAVLVPLFERDGEACTVLTLRSAALRKHSGQWSFPGGSTDDSDAHAMATAVREAHEEIGLDPESVEVLGLLGDVPTPTGFTITPVVGRCDPAPHSYLPNAAEVAEVLEVQLARIGPATERGQVERWGQTFRIIAFDIEGRNVWGATARILDDLLAVVAGRATGNPRAAG